MKFIKVINTKKYMYKVYVHIIGNCLCTSNNFLNKLKQLTVSVIHFRQKLFRQLFSITIFDSFPFHSIKL